MFSSAEATTDNKRAALDQLRFNKIRNAARSNHASSSSILPPAPSQISPPPQARDATVPSRYFPSTPATYGNVLVPNSSPLGPETSYRPYQPYIQGRGYNKEPVSTTSHLDTFNQTHAAHSVDPLSLPSGFVSNDSSKNASLRRKWGADERLVNSGYGEAPPHKRVKRGSSQDATVNQDSPQSPDILRAGQRRRALNLSSDAMSISSDDSLPDPNRILSGSSKPRISRNRPSPSPDLSTPADLSNDIKFTRFKLTMPMEPPARVHAAWIQAGGDVKKATEFCSDTNWLPTPPPSNKADNDTTGRVKEIDEASKAQKAAAKEKGKRSQIYANRSALEAKVQRQVTPSPSKATIDLTESPSTPAIPLPRSKRVKKLVVDSESEFDSVDSDTDEKMPKRSRVDTHESRALEYFNSMGPEALQELTGCSSDQANVIINLRPFESVDDLNEKLGQGRKKAGPGGISPRMFEESKNIFEGYGTVDSILEGCEQIGTSLRTAIATWTVDPINVKGKGRANIDLGAIGDEGEDGALAMLTIAPLKQKAKEYLDRQPSLVSESVQLKEYQLLGVNWLNLLYGKKLSCILADEMGLGKTIQIISFLAYLKERGNTGPHLVVVPSSTLENWCREFARFAPSISVQTYYAGKADRPQLRQTLVDTQRCKNRKGQGWEVLITTYNLAQGDGLDRNFFRKIEWDCCIYDEGHVLKNFQSQRYQSLLKFGSKWRVLLTGTPLQNNLQELVSLMNFILPDQFAGSIVALRAIFKVKGDSKVSLLSQERVSRAKKMMTPFVLRRRKDQVLKDLPNKTERIEWCEMTDRQKFIYTDALRRSRKTVLDVIDAVIEEDRSSTKLKPAPAKKMKPTGRPKEKVYLENSSNVLMDLRKAASHPMLFRTLYTNDILSSITKQLLKEPDFKKRGAIFDHVKEDMSVMTDAELQVFCATYKSTQKYLQDTNCYLEAGKVETLLKLLDGYIQEGRKILIFSQFTQILDILQAILKLKEIHYLLLTGSTPVDVRQTLVDEFTEDETIPVFLLSTKAGGMGINLTAASVVIMFDQDFNPHNDRQAQDRAYRIGQKRDVEVVKLISRGTIEEDMLRLGETKLALDEAVAGDGDGKGESAQERQMKTSLMNVLRQQFERQEEDA